MEELLELVWLIPALPLFGFGLLLVFGRRLGEPLAGWLATLMMVGSFVFTLLVFIGLLDRPDTERFFEYRLFSWVPAGDLQVDMGFLVDPLSLTMALFITGVGALIHMYSIEYMHGDEHFSKFFLLLNFFAFSMLMLVLGSNLLVTFIGWEGVGAASYLLISFWFTEPANAAAGKKAFIANRVGDWGFLIAMFMAFFTFGTLNYGEIFFSIENEGVRAMAASAIVVLLLVGAAGKSAQFPLYLWLPDAMAGPTPVSALIHAATMVTGGVYLLTRVNPIIAASWSWIPDLIGWVALATAFIAATIAVAQNDIKRVLAWSTISQLGFMFVAIGAGAYVAAVFHMVTHAFFKALLFLGAGSVIHGMHDEQDMRRYGGLAKVMPITAGTMIVGWLAIAGVPPFAGFWSKDEILAFAWNENRFMWGLLLFTALLTAFYMTRLVIMTFFGEKRWPEGAHPHEPGLLMLAPLVLLALLSMSAGILNLPFFKEFKHLTIWLEPSVLFENERELAFAGRTAWILGGIAIVVGALAIYLAYAVYVRKRIAPERVEQPLFQHAWYYDETVSDIVAGPGTEAFEATARFDQRIIDGAVNGVGQLVRASAGQVRKLQTGLVRSYAIGVAAGAVAIMAFFISRVTF